ncbi:MAG: S8 family serine peptidase [Crocinitomicaceae bacterium]|nr:S8 family serine peptidase [Crocinitomicaceae bacterium]
MKTQSTLVLFFVLMLGYSIGFSQNVSSNFKDGTIYVKTWDLIPEDLALYVEKQNLLHTTLAIFGIEKIERAFKTEGTSMQHVYRIDFKQIWLVDQLLSVLQSLAPIEFAEKAPLYKLTYMPNDFNTGLQSGLVQVEAHEAWDIHKGTDRVTIAIIDNGVNIQHEDLSPNLWVNEGEIPNNGLDDDLNGYIDDVYGFDVADNDGNPIPPDKGSPAFVHGTHCAGVASARTDNGRGVASLGYNARIMSVKATPNSTQGNVLTNAYEAVDYALKNGADIISMSFGSTTSQLTWNVLLAQAEQQGTLLVAAAGNDNSDEVYYPAGYENVLSVAAVDGNDEKASFSNYGPTIDVTAPGVVVRSTFFPGNSAYGNLSGTSMACPMVAGLAAMLKSYDESLTAAQLRSLIKSGCDDISATSGNYSGQLGKGRINAKNSIQLLSGVNLSQTLDDSFVYQVYPNPASDKIYLKTNEDVGVGSLVLIYDFTGKVVRQYEPGLLIKQTPIELDVIGLTEGLYTVQFQYKDYAKTTRILKMP